MSTFENTIDKLGDRAVLDSILKKTITEFCDDTVTNISPYCFYKCTNLTKVHLVKVVKIDNWAFASTGITTLIIDNPVPPTLQNVGAIVKNTGLRIIVPKGALSAYLSATNWSSFIDYLEEDTK